MKPLKKQLIDTESRKVLSGAGVAGVGGWVGQNGGMLVKPEVLEDKHDNYSS